MSHITTIKDILIKDLRVLQLAVQRLPDSRLEVHEPKPIRLYQDAAIETVAQVHLKNWNYPVLISPQGQVHYDNCEGRWGNLAELNKLKQMVGLEKAKQLAKAQGYLCREQQKQDGAVVLELTR
jgi:hypothetical protein